MKKENHPVNFMYFIALFSILINVGYLIAIGHLVSLFSGFTIFAFIIILIGQIFEEKELVGLDPILRVNTKKKWTIIKYSIDKDNYGQDIITYRALRNGKKIYYARHTSFEKLKTAIIYAEKYGTEKVFNHEYLSLDETMEQLKLERIRDKNKKRENYYIKTKKPIWP